MLAAAALVLPALLTPHATAAAGPTAPAVRAIPATATTTATTTTTTAAAGRPAAAAADAVVQLTGVSPAVVAPGQALVVTGTIRNDGTTPLARPTVRVVAGTLANTRAAVRDWAAQAGPARGDVIGQTRLKGNVAPGTAAGFRISIEGVASLRTDATYGAVPLSVESGTSAVRTFAGYQRIKQYQPLSISWAVPLTLDPDPDLFGASGTARETAWTSALDASSRVTRVLDATQDAPVTWALDPSLTPSLLPDPIDAGQTGTQERVLRTATEDRITQEARSHTPWVLPDTDADLGAVVGQAGATGLVRELVGRSDEAADALGGRADIAWPADGTYTARAESGLRQLFRVPSLAGQVASSNALPSGLNGLTPGAVQRSTTGLPLLAYDDSLSALLGRTTSPQESLLSTQQFIADTAALLGELPGTAGRSVFVVAPRSFNPDPEATRRFFDTVQTLPWLTPSTTGAQLAQARRTATTQAAPVTRPTTPVTTGSKPVLTGARVAELDRTLRTVRGVAQIRDDGDEFARTWTRAAEQLFSTRWRSAPTAWNTLSGRVTAATRQTTTAVKVSAGTINFLADSGRLQITVTNDLDVPVENVKLTVEASNPRLQIDSQPSVLRIGPRSRATVNVSVTALAAGLVPLRTTLTTPDGTVVGQGADVQVHVTPTGNWVYLVLGGVAALVIALGIVRTVRRRPSRTDRGPGADPQTVEARG
ncbi:hypothetical protein ASD62_11635 [Phycicoccus sp. Root563]|nr:hypothetical protein ASC58_11665 [Phycicoccus sp. Root101]KQZ89853.1 hypothetical protein ASD62_11635 [Phycicoccus sp. Root563]